jgi:RNA polymerase Rpb1, domain 5.
MTEYEHVTNDMEAVVEATELPPRLKTEVYETLNQKADDHGGITIEQATDIVTGVENRYLETRVDPLEPVGTVSAQSIGEPGTQMSVPYDERVVVRQKRRDRCRRDRLGRRRRARAGRETRDRRTRSWACAGGTRDALVG